MKFKLANIGPIKDAEIELGDFTLFLGLPSTGKSFALRSIYTSLIFLDKEYEYFLRGKISNILFRRTTITGIDYVISYILSLLGDEYDICDPDALENIIEVVKKEHNFDISGTIENNCLIKISERVNFLEKLKNIASLVKEEVEDEYLKSLRKSVNYTDISSIYINGKRVEDLIENLEMPTIETKDLRLKFGGSVIVEKGEIRYKVNGDYEAGILKIDVELEPIIEQKSDKKLTFEGVQSFKPTTIRSFILRRVLPLEKMAEDLIKEYANTIGFIYSIIFIPYGRSELELINEESTSVYSSITDIEERIIAERFSPLNSLDRSIINFLFHINHVKEKIRRNEITDSYIINLISAITKTRIKVDEKRNIVFEIQNGVELGPFYASAMINEVTSILLPLLDLQTPGLVLVEEPESQLHLAYQVLLFLALLSLVQHGFRFAITTHSDLIASFLGDLVRYKPSKEKIAEVLKKILKLDSLPLIIEKIVEDVEKTINEGKIKVYYFDFENGTAKSTAREVPATELTYNVPGITKEVIDSIVDWETELIGDD